MVIPSTPDYSSALNTMQPHVLTEILTAYNVPARLQLLVLDFLTNRQQFVGTPSELSSIITINTGAPQGCVLSAFFIYCVHKCSISIFPQQQNHKIYR